MGEARTDVGVWPVQAQPESKRVEHPSRKLDPLRAYTACVSVIGAGLLIWCLSDGSRLSLHVLLFVVLVILAELTTSEVFSSQIAFTMSSAVHFAALLLFGIPPAVLIAMVGGLTATLVIDTARRHQGRPSPVSILQRAPFNMASLGLAIVVAGNVYVLLGGQLGDIARSSNLLAMVLAAATAEVANTILVVKAVSLQTGIPSVQVWKKNVSWALPIQLLSMVVGGGGLALGYQTAGLVGVGVFFLPIVLTIYAFKLYVRQTKAQMLHLEEIVAERTDDLRRTNTELKRVDRIKTRFFSMINHEMRNPLHSVLGYVELLLATKPLSEDQGLMLSSTRESGQRLLDLVNDILDSSRLQDNKLNIVPKTIPIRSSVNKALTMVRPMAEEKHISITVDVPQTIPDIWADPRRVVQILVNLLSNAVKYTPDTGSVTIAAQRSETDSMVEISVSDNGIGIPADQLPHIFDCFSRIERTEIQHTNGTGLGLYIVNGLVKAHGGEIRVKSEEGRGSCVTFALPVADESLTDGLRRDVSSYFAIRSPVVQQT